MSNNDFERHETISAKERNEKSPVWDMSQERAFIETLLVQRFNFFMIFFSLVIGGALNAKVQLHLQIVLTLGAIICSLFASVLGRTQEKLDLILDDLFQDPSHPATIINNRARKTGSRRKLIGIWIPQLCALILILGAILSLFNIIKCVSCIP